MMPTPASTEGAQLLEEALAFIRRFVALSEAQARVLTLWIAHTHSFDSAEATPYLAITSAEKQSGKTRLLEVLETLVANPWFTGKVTAAVLSRKISAEQPTLLLDESDAAFGGNKEYAETLRGVLNTGHRRSGKASCCVGQGANFVFQDFSTFCPKAIAGIGKLPDTVADRAIPIRLKRAAPGEVIARFRLRDVQIESTTLREAIAAWSQKLAELIAITRPELPEALSDRQQDGAEPLLAIAEAAGGEWPQRARRALVELCAEAQNADDSTGKLLLADIRQIFEAKGVDRIESADLASLLCEVETSSWGDWSRGRPLLPAKLARLLKPFAIGPHSIRVGDRTPKGYELEDFKDAFLRYLRPDENAPPPSPTLQTATPQQFNRGAVSHAFSRRNTEADVAATIWPKLNVYKPCCGVAVLSPSESEEQGVEEEL